MYYLFLQRVWQLAGLCKLACYQLRVVGAVAHLGASHFSLLASLVREVEMSRNGRVSF